MRVLVCGVGNALRGDDAFGVHAVAALSRDPRLPADVTVIETGIGGIHLVQELMRGYDALLLLDCVDRAAPPGRLMLLEPELPDIAALGEPERRDFFCDMHYATPIRALSLARELGALPAIVRIIGCQAADADSYGTEMSQAVRDAIAAAVEMALDVVGAIAAEASPPRS